MSLGADVRSYKDLAKMASKDQFEPEVRFLLLSLESNI